MRAVYVVPLCAILVAIGLVLSLGKRPSFPDATPLPALAASPASPQPPDGVPLIQQSESPDLATDGLACIQNALGGVRAFAGVSSLRILGNTKPTATVRPRPIANKREIGMVFPDRYKRRDVGTTRPDLPPLIAATGFDGSLLLSYPQPPDDVADKMMLAARREFVQQVLRRLPRQLPGVRLSERTRLDADGDRLSIDAYGTDGLVATLLADRRTCVPMALQYASGSESYRIDLSEFRPFAGILFPTVLRTLKNDQPWTDEHVSDVQVNRPIEDEFFRR